MSQFVKVTQELVESFASQRPLRAGSLIVTLYGDVLAPRGGTAWLGSLINALEPFGLNDRLTRTSVFRLAKDGWLTSTPVGRKSYYGLTDVGQRRFEAAAKRIYAAPVDDWDGQWLLVLINGLEASTKEQVRKELGWLGFGSLAPGLLGHPNPDTPAIMEFLKEQKLEDDVWLMHGQRVAMTSGQTVRDWVSRSWQLEDLENRYEKFLQQFRPIYQAARSARQLDPEMAFRTRVLLIHEYRKVHLRDPLLPNTLLPAAWPGRSAYQLCRNLYGKVVTDSERYVTEQFETADGPLPAVSSYFFDRFGGMSKRR